MADKKQPSGWNLPEGCCVYSVLSHTLFVIQALSLFTS